MSQIITPDGFGHDAFGPDGCLLDFEAFWNGWDLPEEAPLGVILAVDADPTDLAPWFERLSLIVLPFASSADGRGFSLARRLRQLGYKGRIRARGHVLVDQFRAALRVGIDEIEIDDAQAARMPEAQWLAARQGEDYRSRLFAAE